MAFVEALYRPSDLRYFTEHRLRELSNCPTYEAKMARFYALVQAGPNPTSMPNPPIDPIGGRV